MDSMEDDLVQKDPRDPRSPAPRHAPWRRRLVAALALPLAGAPAFAETPAKAGAWPGDGLPLPLTVKTAADLRLKAAAERQYLIFNLLAGGKQAFDRGDFAAAVSKWEALLRLPGLEPEIDRAVRPLLAEALEKSGGSAAAPVAAGPPPAAPPPPPAAAAAPLAVTVAGTVVGGGAIGPGGTVVWLKRQGGPTPRPAPAKGRAIVQRGKTFVPHVLPIPIGTKVDFRNDDDIFHNVFSLSRPNDFDAGLYKGGESWTKTFSTPGPVQVLCNIHATMLAYVVVVDTPWYGQADAGGAFQIRNVPPGDYDLEAWHEGSSQTMRTKVTVGERGLRGVTVKVAGDRRAPAAVPDKYGKPRQVQLGY